jgi:hypothetical protein
MLSKCNLDHGCLSCDKYKTSACDSCFKHEFKSMQCQVYDNCINCQFHNPYYDDLNKEK